MSVHGFPCMRSSGYIFDTKWVRKVLLIFMHFCVLALLLTNCEPESESSQIEKLRLNMSRDNNIHILSSLDQSSCICPISIYWVTAKACQVVDMTVGKIEKPLLMCLIYWKLKLLYTSFLSLFAFFFRWRNCYFNYLHLFFPVRFLGFIQEEQVVPSSVSPGSLVHICSVACGVWFILFPSDSPVKPERLRRGRIPVPNPEPCT